MAPPFNGRKGTFSQKFDLCQNSVDFEENSVLSERGKRAITACLQPRQRPCFLTDEAGDAPRFAPSQNAGNPLWRAFLNIDIQGKQSLPLDIIEAPFNEIL